MNANVAGSISIVFFLILGYDVFHACPASGYLAGPQGVRLRFVVLSSTFCWCMSKLHHFSTNELREAVRLKQVKSTHTRRPTLDFRSLFLIWAVPCISIESMKEATSPDDDHDATSTNTVTECTTYNIIIVGVMMNDR